MSSAFAWMAQQLERAGSAAASSSPRRFNPRPPGVIRDGSATALVLHLLKQNPERFHHHCEILKTVGRSKVAVDWALLFLRQQELIEAVADFSRNPRYLRYRIKNNRAKVPTGD